MKCCNKKYSAGNLTYKNTYNCECRRKNLSNILSHILQNQDWLHCHFFKINISNSKAEKNIIDKKFKYLLQIKFNF